MENKIGDNSPKTNLEFTPQINSTKLGVESISDWSGKKFMSSKNQIKKYRSNKKIENIFEKEFNEWIKVNLKNY